MFTKNVKNYSSFKAFMIVNTSNYHLSWVIKTD